MSDQHNLDRFHFLICLDMDDQHILDIMIRNLDHINFDVWIFFDKQVGPFE